MEADWEYEIGGGAPVIDAGWAGFVNLVRRPEQVSEIAEAGSLAALQDALLWLNGPDSPVWTCKCDFWPELEAGSFDADEMDAPSTAAASGAGCYIDLLARDTERWDSPDAVSRDCRLICGRLRATPLPGCRADLVVRDAAFDEERFGFGVTAYLSSCGTSTADARQTLEQALHDFAATFTAWPPAAVADSPLQ
jgi:hypothetical protein